MGAPVIVYCADCYHEEAAHLTYKDTQFCMMCTDVPPGDKAIHKFKVMIGD